MSLLFLLALRVWKPSFPAMFFIVVLSTAMVWLLGLDVRGVEVVGDVPTGLPQLTLVPITWEVVETLLPAAVAIALVGFMESFAVAKKIAERHGEDDELEANRELVGLGAANIAAGSSAVCSAARSPSIFSSPSPGCCTSVDWSCGPSSQPAVVITITTSTSANGGLIIFVAPEAGRHSSVFGHRRFVRRIVAPSDRPTGTRQGSSAGS